MSHRKRDATHPPGKHPAGAPKIPLGSWKFTAYLLDMRDMALKVSQDPRVGPRDFWKLLEPLDTTNTVWNRLDRKDVEALEIEDRKVFLSRYIPACITAMARVSGLLMPLQQSGLVVLDKNESESAAARRLEKGGLTPDITAMAPLTSEVPGFSGVFLWMLQTRLEARLKTGHLLPKPGEGDEDLAFRIKRTQQTIGAERLYGETRAATTEYLRRAYGGNDPVIPTVLGTNGAPFVFMWLMSLNLIDDMIDGLLKGKPLFRAAERQEGNESPGFTLTDDGIDAGLCGIGREDE